VQSFRSALFLAIVCSMLVPNASEAAERSKPVPQADPLPDAKKWDKLRGTFYGRGGEIKDMLLREGGGTAESEAAVAAGLKWIARQQEADGHWRLNGNFPDSGPANDIAATAFGLLPMLGTDHTHKAGRA